LAHYGPRLGELLNAEVHLHTDLRKRGYRLRHEPNVVTHHLNISLESGYRRLAFHTGRVYGALRWQEGGWSLARRRAYLAGSPLIPFLRVKRVTAQARRIGRTDLLGEIIPTLARIALAGTLGEAIGYAYGPGDSARGQTPYELDRDRFMIARDRRALG
jgi:hypothetical protein